MLLFLETKIKFARSDAAALRWTAAIVRNRRHVLDVHDVQARRGQRAHGRFAAGTRTLYTNFNRFQALLVARRSGGLRRGLLRRVRCSLARTLEANRSGGR